jgi:GntR family transcriptional regulator
MSVAEVPGLPRYREIEHALRTRVAALRPGDRLPSDAALSAEFGVSRMTARNAFQKLIDEGLITRDPGRGSFVADPPAHRRAHRLLSLTTEMRRRGRLPGSRVIECALRDATDAEAAALRVRPGDPVFALARLRLADGTPIAVERAVLPERCAGPLLAADLSSASMHETLAAAGTVPTRGHGTVGAEAATAVDADLLDVRAGEPLLVERRVILDQRGRPMEWTESRYPGDRYALDVAFAVEGPDAG